MDKGPFERFNVSNAPNHKLHNFTDDDRACFNARIPPCLATVAVSESGLLIDNLDIILCQLTHWDSPLGTHPECIKRVTNDHQEFA